MTTIEELRRRGVLKFGKELPSDQYVSTGIPDLDSLVGGWEPGFNLISGIAGTGKSLICAETMSNLMSQGFPTIVVDSEDSFTLWKNHLPILESAWMIPANINPTLPFGYDFISTHNALAELLAEAHSCGTPAKAVIIDCLDGILLRREGKILNSYSRFENNDPNEYWHTIENFVASLDKLGLFYHIPIIATKHDYEFYDGILDNNISYLDPDQTMVTMKSVAEKNVNIVLSTYAHTQIATSPFSVYVGNRGLNNTPFITAGNKHGRRYFDYVENWDDPTHLILGVTAQKTKLPHRDDITPVAIPFTDFANFEYIAPTSSYKEARSTIFEGVYQGHDYEPESTAGSAGVDVYYAPANQDQDELAEKDRSPNSQYYPWQ